MRFSQSIENLAPALVAAKANITTQLEKVGDNPHFKSKFVPLDAVFEAIEGTLAEQGITVLQEGAPRDNGVEVSTILLHKSGEWMQSYGTFMPARNAADPQAFGSANTYARRYDLMTTLGLSGDSDDDGNEAAREVASNEDLEALLG